MADRPCPFCQPSDDLNARTIYRSDLSPVTAKMELGLANEREAQERADTGITSTDQLLAWTERLKFDVEALRRLSGVR